MYHTHYMSLCTYVHTCVLPPVASCIRDRDNDAAALKHEKNAPMPFIMPKARNSYTQNAHMYSCIYYTYFSITHIRSTIILHSPIMI